MTEAVTHHVRARYRAVMEVWWPVSLAAGPVKAAKQPRALLLTQTVRDALQDVLQINLTVATTATHQP